MFNSYSKDNNYNYFEWRRKSVSALDLAIVFYVYA